jgi:hypothetical protein
MRADLGDVLAAFPAGIKYLANKPAPVDEDAFNKACGVGKHEHISRHFSGS